jgi:hypothetical protein
MKNLILFSFLSVFSLSGCNSVKYMVDNDYSFSTDFTTYFNYNFLACEIDTSYICTEIQDAIRRQMRARGYKLTDESPGLLVSYNIIQERVGYQGYNQPMLTRWINQYDKDDTYKKQKYNFSGGMIMVSLLDAESSQLIWRGYAGGVFDQNIKKPVNYYRSIVRNIFDQYPLFAAGEKPRKLTEYEI